MVDQTVLEQLYLRMHISNLDEDFEFLGTVQLDSCSLENYPSVSTFYSSAVIIPFSNIGRILICTVMVIVRILLF